MSAAIIGRLGQSNMHHAFALYVKVIEFTGLQGTKGLQKNREHK